MKRVFIWVCLGILVFCLAGGVGAAAKVQKTPVPASKAVPESSMIIFKPERLGEYRLFTAYGGGAVAVGLGYLFPVERDYDVILDAAYYLGNQYSILTAKLAADVKIGQDLYTGLSLGWVSYSQTIADIPGLSGNTASGSHIDAGIFLGKEIREWRVQAGYGTAMGLTGELSYKF